MFSMSSSSAAGDGRASRAPRLAPVLSLVALALAMAACNGSPTGPGLVSSERRVQTGGGGGTFCPDCSPLGRVEIVAGGGVLNGQTIGAQVGADYTAFHFTSHLEGRGRFDTGFVDIEVRDGSALIRQISYTKDGRIYQDADVTAPALVREIRDDACAPTGVMVETTIRVTLENFGRTTIAERHCARGTR